MGAPLRSLAGAWAKVPCRVRRPGDVASRLPVRALSAHSRGSLPHGAAHARTADLALTLARRAAYAARPWAR